MRCCRSGLCSSLHRTKRCDGYDGLVTLEQLCDVIHEEGLPTEVLAASIEKPQEIVEYALAGADIVTMPYHVFTDTF